MEAVHAELLELRNAGEARDKAVAGKEEELVGVKAKCEEFVAQQSQASETIEKLKHDSKEEIQQLKEANARLEKEKEGTLCFTENKDSATKMGSPWSRI